MKKYFSIAKLTVSEYMIYRMNFIMWRIRQVVLFLVIYFLWVSIYANHTTIFGYTETQMLAYIFLIGLVRTLVLGTTTWDIGEVINSGKLTNILLRPINFFSVYLARDMADKSLNPFFSFFEIFLLFILLKPSIFFQTDIVLLSCSVLTVFLGILGYFFFSMIFGLIGFWTQDYWPPRFLSFVLAEILSGSLFPLDTLPAAIFRVSQFLPFSYMLYFPIRVYLGKVSIGEIFVGIGINIFWILVFFFLNQLLWKRGLKVYEAVGR